MIGRVLMYDDRRLTTWPYYRSGEASDYRNTRSICGRHLMLILARSDVHAWLVYKKHEYTVLLDGRVCNLLMDDDELARLGAHG